jgi:CubicO group peptidase (beta-lactamase class C family)
MKYHFKIWLPIHLVTSLFVILISPLTLAQENIDLRNQLAKELKNQGVTGAVWSIVNDGEIFTDSWGIKNMDEQTKLNPDDLVNVGSVAKTVLSTGILLLVTQNKLSLETPVEEILPEIRFDNKWDQPVTVKHLMDHTSGLENMRLWQMFSQNASPAAPLLYSFSKDPDVLNINTKPGTEFSYSNMGYTLLGLVIEKISGERYEDFLDKNLLVPLGMVNSTFHFVNQVGPEANTKLAMGHLDNKITHPALPIYLRPAGQFTTNAEDMGLFLQFLLNKGLNDGKQLVSKQLIESMGTVSGTDAAINGLYKGYSLGLLQRDWHNNVGLFHLGSIVGYRAMIYLFPLQQKAFFISVNMDSETANYENLNKILIENLALTKDNPISIGKLPENIDEWKGTYIPSKSAFKSLKYFDIITGYQIVRTTDELVNLISFQQDKKILYPTDKLLFRTQKSTIPSYTFYQKEGKFYFSDGLNTYQKINRIFLFVLWFSLFTGLAGIVFTLAKGLKALFSKGTSFIQTSIAIPFLAIVLLVLPIPFFFIQSFVSIGDKTVASVLAALVTFILPFCCLYGIWREFAVMKNKGKFGYDFVALISVMQLLLVLLFFGLIPIMLWV